MTGNVLTNIHTDSLYYSLYFCSKYIHNESQKYSLIWHAERLHHLYGFLSQNPNIPKTLQKCQGHDRQGKTKEL